MGFLRNLFPKNSPVRKVWYMFKAVLAAFWYRFPAKKIQIIGITGTDGKTTTVEMISHIFQTAKILHLKISTVSIFLNEKHSKNATKRTTLSPWQMQKLLRRAVQKKSEVAILEISSHATEQRRIFGIRCDIAGIINVSEGHVDDHGSFEKYANAKKLLFTKYLKTSGAAVLNMNDTVVSSWKEDISAQKIAISSPYIEKLGIPGEFNKENAAVASAVAESYGVSNIDIAKALKNFVGVEGRLEKIDCGQNFDVYIDFAVTSNAFKHLLESAKELTQNHLWVVFGCYGDVDKKRRPEMGKLAGEIADFVVLTDDEPYTESADMIREQVREGIQKTKVWNDGDDSVHFWEIPDRRNAIEFALQRAKPGDVVVIPGLGAEESRNIGGMEVPWNDKEIVKEILGI